MIALIPLLEFLFWEAEQVVNEYRNYNDPLDQFAYLVLELPKRQIFIMEIKELLYSQVINNYVIMM